jgi:hypothetical protein
LSEAVVAASCPVSFSQYPTARRLLTGKDPRSPISRLVDQINRIPRAVDLPSAIHALNIMNNIIFQLTRGEPQINNIGQDVGGGGVILKGEDFNPHYQQLDWVLESRTYDQVEVINPDNEDQKIPIKVLSTVTFHNPNGANLQYFGTE